MSNIYMNNIFNNKMEELIQYYNVEVNNVISLMSSQRINAREETDELMILRNMTPEQQNLPQQMSISNFAEQLSSLFGGLVPHEDEEMGVANNNEAASYQPLVITAIMTSNLNGDGVRLSIQQNTHGNLSSVLTNLLSGFVGTNQSDVILPMTEEGINKLEEKKYCDIDDPNKCDTCAICRETFKRDSLLTILPCKHIFHKECVCEWLKNYHHKCPICRKDCGGEGDYKPILD